MKRAAGTHGYTGETEQKSCCTILAGSTLDAGVEGLLKSEARRVKQSEVMVA